MGKTPISSALRSIFILFTDVSQVPRTFPDTQYLLNKYLLSKWMQDKWHGFPSPYLPMSKYSLGQFPHYPCKYAEYSPRCGSLIL